MADRVLKLLLGQGQARVYMADTRELVETARTIHNCSPVCTAALGRLLTGAVIMGVQLKTGDERISLDIQGDGPAGRAMAVCDAAGQVKGYITNPQADLPPRGEKLDVGGALGHHGYLTVIRGGSRGEPYVGRCDLVSGEVAIDLATYYLQSEQTPSLISLGVMVDTDQSVASAGGIMIQPLPGCSEELISALELRSPIMADMSGILHDAANLEQLALDLFRDLQPEVIGEVTPSWHCECSRERIAGVLTSLGATELQDMKEKDGGAQVHCHFCNTDYDFSAEDLDALIAAIASAEQTHE